MEYTLPPSRSLKSAVIEHSRVIHALALRDIKTRFGATYFGFLFGMLMPLMHIAIIMTIYISLGRRAPIGTDVALYLGTAIVPFILWSYTHQKVMQCFGQNQALTSFPIVKFIDILIARSIVELLNATLIVCVVASAFALTGSDIFVIDPPRFLYALTLAYVLGVSTGFIFGLLAKLAPGAMIIGFVLVPLYWGTSGVFFIPEALPEQAKWIVSFFPLAHIVDFGRASFYSNYITGFFSLSYVHAVIIANICIGLTVERMLRHVITSK